MKILVVDDSVVFRTQISTLLKEVDGVEIIGTAANGKIALQKLEQGSIDLMTLDLEMPEMDGISTLKAMRAKGFKTKVIVFSSLTIAGAEKALEALSAGADDVALKPHGDIMSFEHAQEMIRSALIPKVLQFVGRIESKAVPVTVKAPKTVIPEKGKAKRHIADLLPTAVVIASSTGGPSALETIFSQLKGPFNKPIFIAQHMPPVFTELLAKRLREMCGADVHEAKDGEVVKPNGVYVAPGDYHMVLVRVDGVVKIMLNQDPHRNSVRPAADFLFESASEVYMSSLLGVVLTGMGEDGAIGARRIRENSGAILIQDKESCVVFGMPGAIFNNDDFDEIGDLKMITNVLRKVIT